MQRAALLCSYRGSPGSKAITAPRYVLCAWSQSEDKPRRKPEMMLARDVTGKELSFELCVQAETFKEQASRASLREGAAAATARQLSPLRPACTVEQGPPGLRLEVGKWEFDTCTIMVSLLVFPAMPLSVMAHRRDHQSRACLLCVWQLERCWYWDRRGRSETGSVCR